MTEFPQCGVGGGGVRLEVIYLDNNASTPVEEPVFSSMLPWLKENPGNASSVHAAGKLARTAVESARAGVAGLLVCPPEAVVFTSGATESITSAVVSAWTLQPEKPLFLVSDIDHSATLRAAAGLVGESNLRFIPVDSTGRYDLTALAKTLEENGPRIALASLLWASNETGTLPGVEAAAEMLAAHGIAIHVDAVQAVGKIPVHPGGLPIDYLSFSAHKFHGPKGVGGLYIRPGRRFHPMLPGGGQENGRRGGTENVAGIVGLGAAAALAAGRLADGTWQRVGQLRDDLEAAVLSAWPGARTVGHPVERLANTSCLHFSGLPAATAMVLLDEAGICCSAGSACTSHSPEPSRGLLALGLSPAEALESLRFSLSAATTPEEISTAIPIIVRVLGKIRDSRASGGVVRRG